MAVGKTTVRYDALARIAKAVKRIREQPEAAHGDGCHRTQPPSSQNGTGDASRNACADIRAVIEKAEGGA